ncbi:hypothetical protein HPP92_029114 [Vanilla planifolia]|uniref:Uncharacterized protein n=1 Tax=Vanilla planifolia TaxID=51239 RepID=A0A835P3I7_VANPL|nr:hypothetical protein HPP92_029114 [Vanilla planifolia]KAG0445896.1 hypothetical protein HPP92_029103 [Vanilla planifolia]
MEEEEVRDLDPCMRKERRSGFLLSVVVPLVEIHQRRELPSLFLALEQSVGSVLSIVEIESIGLVHKMSGVSKSFDWMWRRLLIVLDETRVRVGRSMFRIFELYGNPKADVEEIFSWLRSGCVRQQPIEELAKIGLVFEFTQGFSTGPEGVALANSPLNIGSNLKSSQLKETQVSELVIKLEAPLLGKE